MNVFIVLVCFIATVNVCTAYLCLINPQQRGPMGDLNTVGSYNCRMTLKGCGGRLPEQRTTIPTYKENSTITVTFQKNMDFWNKSFPGYFAVNLIYSYDKFVKELARVEDNGEPSLFVYTVSATLPGPLKTYPYMYGIQVEYITNNPEAPAFYACTDFLVTE